MIGTTHLGQTLGDNLDNIIYTSNPAFRIVKQESRNQRLEELHNLQEAMLDLPQPWDTLLFSSI